MSVDRSRLSVFLSGSGRTLVNLHRAILDGRLDASIVDVVASRMCRGVERARDAGLPVEIVGGQFTADSLLERVDSKRIGLVVLAGYLRKMPVPVLLRERIVNIHPGLLPGDGTGGRFGGEGMYGIRVHRAVLDAGVPETGCTVHYCDEGYDSGPVLLRKTCRVEPGDTPETLAERVFALELEAYPEALQLAIAGSRTKS